MGMTASSLVSNENATKSINVLQFLEYEGYPLGIQDEFSGRNPVGEEGSPYQVQEHSFVDENQPKEHQSNSDCHTNDQPCTDITTSSNLKASKSSIPKHMSGLEELASVVKIFVDSVQADFVSPWQMMAPVMKTGSGFVVKGRMIMTNAHLVSDQIRVLVRRHGNPKRFLARILAVCHECDLALVTVDDEAFWDGLKALPFGGLPQLRESVVVLGYPTGGDQLSITEGVVSRVGVSKYAHSSLGLITVQIDAAINPGNSGGPALSQGKVVGVAFQGFSQMQNVGYIVPFPVIRHFLNDVALHNRHTGIVSVGIKVQTMENEALKKSKGMHLIPPEALPQNVTASGVLVLEVDMVRANTYFQGKITLPISRYPTVPQSSIEKRCQSDEVQRQSSSRSKTVEPCDMKMPMLLDDIPVAPQDDTTARQRQVKEVAETVIWQPRNWMPSDPDASRSQIGNQTGKLNGSKTFHRCSQGTQDDQSKMPPELVESSVPTNKIGVHAGAPMQTTKMVEDGAANKGGRSVETYKARNKVPLGEKDSQGSENDLTTRTGAEISKSAKQAHQAIQETVETQSAKQNGSPKLQDIAPSNYSAQKEESSELTSNLEDVPYFTRHAGVESFLRKLLGARITLRQVRQLIGFNGNDSSDDKIALAPTMEPKRHKQAHGSKLERPGEEIYPHGMPVKAVTLREADVAASNVPNPHSASTDSATIAQAYEHVGMNRHVFEAKNEHERLISDDPVALSGGKSLEENSLATAVYPIVDNPYFNPNLLHSTEFIGFLEGDVILSIGNYDIADDGTVSLRNLERVSYSYVVTQYFNGETTWAYVLRDGRIIKVTTAKLHQESPHMFEYLVQRLDYQQKRGDEFVVLSLILASEISVGYDQPPCIVRSVNGYDVRNMRELVQLIETTSGDFVKLEVEVNGSNSIQLVLDRKKTQAIHQRLLKDHNITVDRSPDLLTRQ
ncbi:uncharacterized protein LOC34622542 [Cyclospora cayetanensis]|uniref:Uncharacterized protein LOC34622542 n=1 Tax=Cyclospora cayetanensis TaxID=88456 RepID=A0A6P6S0U7_9EIME|nr:uncharacterized protein LOC34622542 [Cyclospora cayetanensis]